MNKNQMDELRSLLDALCEESISAEQMRRLEALLLSDPEAEAYYVQYMTLFAELSRAKLRVSLPLTQAAPPVARYRRVLVWGSLAAAGVAAAILLIIAIGQPADPDWKPMAKKDPERLDDSVAVLLRTHDAEWDATDLPTRPGSPLRPGVLKLKSGVAQLEFYSGASVVLQGPAELQLISKTKAFCVNGRLRATVPPQAQGFTIGSPKMDLVDLGTEFGMHVGAEGKMEVHVFEGKIELHDPAARRKPATALTTGQSVRVENGNRIDPIKLDPTGFPTANEVAAESQKELLRRKKAWADLSATLQKDPSLVAYFPFEIDKARDRTLADRSVGAAKSHDGAIVGSAWGAGRWDGRSGLEFKQVSDRVRFHIKEEVQSITMMAWVRIDGLPNENNSLLMSDGWDPGGLHWQIGADGTLVLGVQSQPKSGGHYHAPQAITPEHFGQWLHLAVVYDRDKKEVSHWINGARAAEPWPLQFDIPLRVGAAEIGNWNIAMHRNKSPIRFFSGCMDEFLIFSRALPDVELTRIYTESRPPS